MKTKDPFVHWYREEIKKSRLGLKEILKERKNLDRINRRGAKILKKYNKQEYDKLKFYNDYDKQERD
jgi:hypothetical protein